MSAHENLFLVVSQWRVARRLEPFSDNDILAKSPFMRNTYVECAAVLDPQVQPPVPGVEIPAVGTVLLSTKAQGREAEGDFVLVVTCSEGKGTPSLELLHDRSGGGSAVRAY